MSYKMAISDPLSLTFFHNFNERSEDLENYEKLYHNVVFADFCFHILFSLQSCKYKQYLQGHPCYYVHKLLRHHNDP